MKQQPSNNNEQTRSTDTLLREALRRRYASQPQLPEGFSERLMQRLAQRRAAQRRKRIWFFTACTTAAAAAIIAVAFVLHRPADLREEKEKEMIVQRGREGREVREVQKVQEVQEVQEVQGVQGVLCKQSEQARAQGVQDNPDIPAIPENPAIPKTQEAQTTQETPETPSPTITPSTPEAAPKTDSASLFRFSPQHLEQLIAVDKTELQAPTQSDKATRLRELISNEQPTKRRSNADLAFTITYSNYMNVDLSSLRQDDKLMETAPLSTITDPDLNPRDSLFMFRPLLFAQQEGGESADAENPQASQAPRSVKKRAPQSTTAQSTQTPTYRDIPSHQSHHSLPLTVGLSVQKALNRICALETGVTYTRLASEFNSNNIKYRIAEQQRVHYIGIPLKVNLNYLNSKHWNAYAAVGVAVDFPADALIESKYVSTLDSRAEKRHVSAPVQFQTAAGLGLQYKFTQHLGLYVEPSAQWYVPTSSSLETYRTEHPFMFAIPVGLRWTL